MKLIDITGQRFGRLLVVAKARSPSPSGGSLWLCRCDCGTEKLLNSSNLRNGTTRSCGCLLTETASAWATSEAFAEARAKGATKHGHKRRSGMSPEYKTWLRMKQRCENPKNRDYPNWGGRGIVVCDRWQAFENFLADMGPRPDPRSTIDRIDPNGNYEPGNCRWASARQQAAENRRDLIPVTIDGVSYPSVDAACRAVGQSTTLAHERMRLGYDALTAVVTPSGQLPNRRTRESYLPRHRRP
ncbi:MAG: hypothetical protein ACOY4K_06580 [Pseudomonadota bacterium]